MVSIASVKKVDPDDIQRSTRKNEKINETISKNKNLALGLPAF